MISETPQGQPGPGFTCAMQSCIFQTVQEHPLSASKLTGQLVVEVREEMPGQLQDVTKSDLLHAAEASPWQCPCSGAFTKSSGLTEAFAVQ